MTKKNEQYNIPKPQEQVLQDYGESGVMPIINHNGDLIVAQKLGERFNLKNYSYDSIKGITVKNLTINGPVTIKDQSIESNTYYKLLKLYNPALATGETSQFSLGRDGNINNVGELNFNFTSSGSTSNSFTIGLYGTPTTLSIGQNVISTNGSINYAEDAQANDSYVITINPPITRLSTGLQVIFKAKTANTGAASLDINGLGAQTIVKGVSTALSNNDILAGMFCLVVYDGTNFVLMNPRTL